MKPVKHESEREFSPESFRSLRSLDLKVRSAQASSALGKETTALTQATEGPKRTRAVKAHFLRKVVKTITGATKRQTPLP